MALVLHGKLAAGLVATALGVACAATETAEGPFESQSSVPAAVPMPAPESLIAPDPLRHCRQGYEADPRDTDLPDGPVRYDLGSGRVDLLVPDAVRSWMSEHHWPAMYDAWDEIRRVDYYCGASNTPAEGSSCAYAQRQEAAGLFRAPIQACAPGDGLAFLMMHRNLLELVKLAFPTHAQLFAGFEHVPRSQTDPENPIPEVAVTWTSAQLAAIERLEQIEAHADEFADDDALGAYIQCEFRWTQLDPKAPVEDPSAGILQYGLYAQWSMLASPGTLGSTRTRVMNQVFWKIHGFIDQVWERYRRARGRDATDPAYASGYLEQCDELHNLATHLASQPEPDGGGQHGGATTMETGIFAQTIRPMFERRCSRCHGVNAPAAGLILGGAGVTSASVYAGSVGVPATNGEYSLIEPGNAERSWLYLKASGEAAQAACDGACDGGVMPPAGQPGLSADQLTAIKLWIEGGAVP